MYQGGKKIVCGAMARRAWVLQRLSPEMGCVPLCLTDDQNKGLPHGPWLGSSITSLAVSPVLVQLELWGEFFPLHIKLWGCEWMGKPAGEKARSLRAVSLVSPQDQQIMCVPLASEQLPWPQGSLCAGSEMQGGRSRV